MTADEVNRRVEAIREARWDDEVAHSMEDELYQSVLHAIADGADDAAELAEAALLTREIRFARCCA